MIWYTMIINETGDYYTFFPGGIVLWYLPLGLVLMQTLTDEVRVISVGWLAGLLCSHRTEHNENRPVLASCMHQPSPTVQLWSVEVAPAEQDTEWRTHKVVGYIGGTCANDCTMHYSQLVVYTDIGNIPLNMFNNIINIECNIVNI